jgi:hypothetical protein
MAMFKKTGITVFNIPSISGESSETLSYGEEIHVVGINTYTGGYKIQLDEGKVDNPSALLRIKEK